MILTLHALSGVILQLVKSMFPDLWLAQLPLVLCFFPPWVPSWSPLISANLRPLWLHIHMVSLCLFPFELHLNFLFWTLKCILAARCHWLSARSATWQISNLNRTIFMKIFQKFARTFRIFPSVVSVRLQRDWKFRSRMTELLFLISCDMCACFVLMCGCKECESSD